MSLIVAWSNADAIADYAEAILHYAFFRLELDGCTTLILDADEPDLVREGDAVAILTGEFEAVHRDDRLKLAPAGVPLLLLSTARDKMPKPTEIAGHPTFFAQIDLDDLKMTDCGASFTGKTESELSTAIRRTSAFLQERHLHRAGTIA